MERCWQRYGGKLVGPEEKTGRKEENKAHFVLFPFSRCALSCVLAFALSLLRVVLWLWTLIEDNRQLVERWEVADLLADNNLLLEAVDCNDLLRSEWHRGERARLRRINLCWTERPVLAEQFTNRILVGICLLSSESFVGSSWVDIQEIELRNRLENRFEFTSGIVCWISLTIVCRCIRVVSCLYPLVESSFRSTPYLEFQSRFV